MKYAVPTVMLMAGNEILSILALILLGVLLLCDIAIADGRRKYR